MFHKSDVFAYLEPYVVLGLITCKTVWNFDMLLGLQIGMNFYILTVLTVLTLYCLAGPARIRWALKIMLLLYFMPNRHGILAALKAKLRTNRT